MAYASGIHVGPDDNAAKVAVEGWLHSALIAGGFTLVASDLVSTSYTTRVYKSAQADNGVVDWYLLVGYTTANPSTLWFSVAEGFSGTSATHVANWVTTPNSALTLDSQGYLAANALEDLTQNWVSGAATNMNYPVSSSNSYWISATPRRVVIGLRNGTTDIYRYLGLYETMLGSSVDPLPLVIVDPAATSSGGSCREPGVTSAGAYNGGLLVVLTQYFSGSNSGAGFTLQNPYTKSWHMQKVLVSSPSSARGYGLRGVAFDVMTAGMPISGTAMGDTISVSGKTYVLFKGTLNVMCFVDTAV